MKAKVGGVFPVLAMGCCVAMTARAIGEGDVAKATIFVLATALVAVCWLLFVRERSK